MEKQKIKKKIRTGFNLKKMIFGSLQPESTVPGSRFPNGTQSLVPFADIRQGTVITDDRRYLKILEILPVNFYLKSRVEQQNIIYYLASYLKIAPTSIQILVTTQRADIDTYCSQMEQYYHSETNDKCKDMILEDAELVNYLAENEALTRHFYLIFAYEGTSASFEDISRELTETAETARQYLDYCGLEVICHEDEDEFLFRTLYRAYHKQTAQNTDFSLLLSQVGIVCGTDKITSATLDEDDQDGVLTLQDALAPTDIEITERSYIKIDEVYHTYLYISGYAYPTVTDCAWLSPLVELGDGISLSFYLEKRRKEQILPKISKTTMINRSRIRDVEDTRTDFEEMDDAISSGLYIKDQLNRENEDFYYMHTLIEVTALDTDALEQQIRHVKNRCTAIGLTARNADWCHEQCFLSLLPLCQLNAEIAAKTKRNILTSAAAAAFPFSSYELCDEKGILLGINQYNQSAVILDNYNSDIYSNGNMAIFGMSGAGKTYTILLMAMRLRMCGVQVFIIAPEKGFEYRGVCDALGGQYIKLARGSDDCINIMEIRRTTLDIDSSLAGINVRNDSVLLDTIQNIRTYFKLKYPAMTPEEGYLLNTAVQECYESFGITQNNETLINPDGSFKQMPTLADLYAFVVKRPELKNIAVIIKDLVDSGMGGETNVNLNSSFTVIDTSSARNEDISASTFIGTVFIRDEMSRSRTRKKAVFGDELWVIAGTEGNEQAADFVIELVKTVRGYGGIFVSATQNVIDYFALRDGKFGDSLLNNSRLKLLLQMEEPEAKKLQDKLGLSDEEVMQIVRCGRGQGLLCAGKNRIAVEIRSSQTQYDLITTNRADLEKREIKNDRF